MSTIQTKICTKCNEEKGLDDYTKGRADCRACHVIAVQNWRKNGKTRRAPTPEEKAEQIRKANLKAFYKLTLDEYDSQLERQDGSCAICGATQADFSERFAVDHDHSCCPGRKSCGECLRGLLCPPCNKGIGHFNDDVAVMANAIAYITMGGDWA